MLERLEQRFDLLVSRQHGMAPRHRSLRTTLDWSYALLSPELQRFFAQLSAFRGGWTLEAAEAVCERERSTVARRLTAPTPSRALEYLEQLTECSFVQAEERGEATRFRMLETLREYGQEQLSPAERAAVDRRHAKYYTTLVERARPHVHSSRQPQ
jgi:predicted ATPase